MRNIAVFYKKFTHMIGFDGETNLLQLIVQSIRKLNSIDHPDSRKMKTPFSR